MSQIRLNGSEPLAGFDELNIVDVEADATAMLMFTSGTAGPSKPAILTHQNITASLQSVLSLPVELVGGGHRLLGVIPMFHVFGVNMVLHLGWILGAPVILEDYVDPARTLKLIREKRASLVAGPPALWQRLVEFGATAADFLDVHMAVSGAGPLPGRLAEAVNDRFGLELHNGYGLTETSATAASTLGITGSPTGSVGRLLPGVSARIVDAAQTDCLVGDPGELWLRGPMISPGYWGGEAPRRNAESWLRTGDIAVVDKSGHLAIVGRLKDLVIVSGFNVHPVEVERVLNLHPSVAQSAVVGEPSKVSGEAVVAFVSAASGVNIDEVELDEHCRKLLAAYKVPHRFIVVSSLPMGPTGKLRRSLLTAQL